VRARVRVRMGCPGLWGGCCGVGFLISGVGFLISVGGGGSEVALKPDREAGEGEGEG
jgi:hypothetical protein